MEVSPSGTVLDGNEMGAGGGGGTAAAIGLGLK